ncbi:hypothetical protein INH39_15225 [Massilia violaceinigra]|uniref:Porin domain-containing protein n=1 Tax=Massilia violaceinigra TaxID=2045208 RepID=A0ABY4AFU5_9BURK|nr:hypothetical protein [Massilia violaceinigra]UOD33700.1 hypothetical protein INH39_15225 [Massilia violaceinigra]
MEFLEVGQGGIAGAEVVDRHLDFADAGGNADQLRDVGGVAAAGQRGAVAHVELIDAFADAQRVAAVGERKIAPGLVRRQDRAALQESACFGTNYFANGVLTRWGLCGQWQNQLILGTFRAQSVYSARWTIPSIPIQRLMPLS